MADSAGAALGAGWVCGLYDLFSVEYRGSAVVVSELMSSGQRDIPYILESNPHPFYSFRGLKNQMRIRIARGLESCAD